MKKRKLVFSLIKEQSIFVTAIISVLTFLSVLTFGITLSISSSIIKWNFQWDKYATVQITNTANTTYVTNILNSNKDKIELVKEISQTDMTKLMKPWINDGAKITQYLPQMFEVKFKNKQSLQDIKNQIVNKARFISYTDALHHVVATGWNIITITSFVFLLILFSISLCIIYITRNIATVHQHELEILNQIGATDNFVAKQMQMIIGKITLLACSIGFILALPVLAIILYIAHSAPVGLLSTIDISKFGWILLIALPIFIVILSVYITKKTTIKLLSDK